MTTTTQKLRDLLETMAAKNKAKDFTKCRSFPEYQTLLQMGTGICKHLVRSLQHSLACEYDCDGCACLEDENMSHASYGQCDLGTVVCLLEDLLNAKITYPTNCINNADRSARIMLWWAEDNGHT